MVSVIIPVYNVAPYLPACIDSVLAQTHADIELLLVDDGSTDGSADICDDYACRDARVTVLHQDNAGPSAARNAALDIAQGEYVAFVDSDDVIHTQYLALLLQYMALSPEVDVVQLPYQIVPSSKRSHYDAARLAKPLPQRVSMQTLSADEALLAMYYQRGTADSSPCKLFRMSLFDGLRFPEAYRVYEDLYLMARLYPRVRRMIWADVPAYFYFKDDSGTLNSLSIRRRDAFYVLTSLEGQYVVKNRKDLIRAVRERRFSVAMNILRLLSHQPHTDANVAMAHRCWTNIKELRSESIQDKNARLKNRLAALLSYLINHK